MSAVTPIGTVYVPLDVNVVVAIDALMLEDSSIHSSVAPVYTNVAQRDAFTAPADRYTASERPGPYTTRRVYEASSVITVMRSPVTAPVDDSWYVLAAVSASARMIELPPEIRYVVSASAPLISVGTMRPAPEHETTDASVSV
jgi:hypothetical protein